MRSGQTYDLDLTLVRAQGCAGTIAQAGTGSFKLIAIGDKVWIEPDQQFWEKAGGADAAVLKQVSGKYLTVKATSQLGSLDGFCKPGQLAGSFGGTITGLVKGETATISGQPALQIKDTGDSASIFVSDTAKPELLRISDGSQGTLDFSGYNSPVTLTAPPAAETLSERQVPGSDRAGQAGQVGHVGGTLAGLAGSDQGLVDLEELGQRGTPASRSSRTSHRRRAARVAATASL